jgi:hypothetical protein
MDPQGLGAPAAGRALDAGLVEQALVDQPRRERVGLAARELQRVRQRVAGRAAGPERGLEDGEFVGTQALPRLCDDGLPRSSIGLVAALESRLAAAFGRRQDRTSAEIRQKIR